MMGTLIKPTSASTAPARSARRGSSIADCSEINPMYRKKRISVDVVRASQTHQVPHVGFPHSEPVTRARNVNIAPVIDSAEAIIDDSRTFNVQPIAAYVA